VAGFILIIAIIIAVCLYRRRNAALDLSSLHDELKWYFDEERILQETGWSKAWGEGFIVKDVTDEKKYVSRLKSLLNNHLDGTRIQYETVHAIFNRTLVSNFVGARKVISLRHKNSPGIFKKDDWQKPEDPRQELRSFYMKNMKN